MTHIIIQFPIRCYETGEVFYRYSPYLYSRHWKRVRIKQLSKHPKCACCDSQAIDIHHRDYSRIGAETPRDVVSLCRACHQTVHDMNESIDTAHFTLQSLLRKAQRVKREPEVAPYSRQKRMLRIAGMVFDVAKLQHALYAPIDQLRLKQ